MKHNYIYALLLVFLLSLANNSDSSDFVCPGVPMVKILSAPERYQGKRVRVVGVIDFEPGVSNNLYLDDFSRRNFIVGELLADS